MKTFAGIVLILFSINQLVAAAIHPERLVCENLKNPDVIDAPNPRLSWINTDPDYKRNQFQTAWEIRVASSRDNLLKNEADLWNSGKVNSDQSFNISYNGKKLSSRQDCWWQVRVWDRKGKVSEWSEPAFWSMGLLDRI